MDPFSFATLSNVKELEELQKKFLENPESVDPSFRLFFEGMAFGQELSGSSKKEYGHDLRIHLLIEAYRTYGHLKSKWNPIATDLRTIPVELALHTFGFTPEDLHTPFPTEGFLKKREASLKELIEALENTYCGTIGFEYKGLGNPELETFIQQEVEERREILSSEAKIQVLKSLIKAELFESFLHTKYVGQKRFSLEGGETFIPLLLEVIERSASLGSQGIILGMAHRGRLNVLANILNKSYSEIFSEFEGHYTPGDLEGTGDVKYHKGFQGELSTSSGTIPVLLVANPSHLESVDPVVVGIAKSYQHQHKRVTPVLIHGDGSIAGQGVVYETLQLSALKGYGTDGTLHIVINNQIGFTTLPQDARSTRYCTEIAKAFHAPSFHVSGEDPLACVFVASLAVKIREKFGCDVFIDLGCYRKYGHNEGDEPFFTQPLEYALIEQKKPVRVLYTQKLIQEGVLSEATAKALEEEFKTKLRAAQNEKFEKPTKQSTSHGYLPLSGALTAVPQDTLFSLAQRLNQVPSEMKIHPKIERLLNTRRDSVLQDKGLDWGTCEMLAYASLVDQGVCVRVSGEDVRRGTFSHRHAVLVDQIQGRRYCPLSHLGKQPGLFEIYNSPLSEFAVLGFEFGYSLLSPGLTIWEAQYGDFANGAQVIIDQYLSSAEQKWEQQSNLTLFLPHGYEGQGPEHSSARIERFLQLASQNNLRILNVTTPSQLFHLIRAQALLEDKRPLILFSPKAILRHKECMSSLSDLTQGHFEEVLEEKTPQREAKTLLFCSGKIFYDLSEEKRKETALIRIEQLYPFPEAKLKEVLRPYSCVKKWVFIQEEHANMGPFEYIRPHLEQLLGKEITYIGREKSAASATGSFALHQKQYAALIKEAFHED